MIKLAVRIPIGPLECDRRKIRPTTTQVFLVFLSILSLDRLPDGHEGIKLEEFGRFSPRI